MHLEKIPQNNKADNNRNNNKSIYTSKMWNSAIFKLFMTWLFKFRTYFAWNLIISFFLNVAPLYLVRSENSWSEQNFEKNSVLPQNDAKSFFFFFIFWKILLSVFPGNTLNLLLYISLQNPFFGKLPVFNLWVKMLLVNQSAKFLKV